MTAAASVLGCWIFARWQDNLWPVIILHSLMNLWWEVFGVDETALGGPSANVARILTIALAVLLTIFRDRIWRPLPIEREGAAAGRADEARIPVEKRDQLSYAF